MQTYRYDGFADALVTLNKFSSDAGHLPMTHILMMLLYMPFGGVIAPTTCQAHPP
jgi:hypothetical protein